MSDLAKPLSILLAAILLLAACGRGGDNMEQSTRMSVPTATGVPTATDVPEPPTPTSVNAEMPVPATAEPPSGPALSALPDDAAAVLRTFLQGMVFELGDPPPRTAPGAVLLVDTIEGRFLEAAGVAEVDGRAMATADRFEIGSITKLFTAVLLLQLHEEGILSLDDTLDRWLPDLAAQLPYGAEMTLRQLASHTAGLDDYERDLYPMSDILTDRSLLERGYQPEELATWIVEHKEPLFPPGQPGQWRYSSAGYVLLALVLEVATGESLGDLYQSRIFDPLAMESAILLDGVPEPGQIVGGYNAAQGEYVDVSRWNPSGAWAAGALAMNASDLATFTVALSHGGIFQNPETLAAMASFVPTGQNRGFTGYGLGMAQLTDGTWGHAGGTPGFAALLIMRPADGTVALFLGNNGTSNVNPVEFSEIVGAAAVPPE